MTTDEKITIAMFATIGLAFILLFGFMGSYILGTIINLGIWIILKYFCEICDGERGTYQWW
jgi:hypothetical protein